MNLKLYALMFKVGKCIPKRFKKRFIEIKFDYKVKYIVQITYNKEINVLKQKVITRMMNHNNQILSFKNYVFYFIFVEMKLEL